MSHNADGGKNNVQYEKRLLAQTEFLEGQNRLLTKDGYVLQR